MTKSQAKTIIILLSVLVVAAVVLVIAQLGGAKKQAATSTEVASEKLRSSSSMPTRQSAGDSAKILETAAVNSIHKPPIPEAPQRWGQYKLRHNWDGQVRVFQHSSNTEILGPEGGRFPSSMNGCGAAMYLVTFKSVNPEVSIAIHLMNAAGSSSASEVLNQGWSLSTNCETPTFEFVSSSGVSNRGDVSYTVYEYIEDSAAPQTYGAERDRESSAEEAHFVKCIGVLGPAMALYSDGSERLAPECENSPEQQRALKGESVCGSLDGWKRVTPAEYEDLCGHSPPTQSTSAPMEGFGTEVESGESGIGYE